MEQFKQKVRMWCAIVSVVATIGAIITFVICTRAIAADTTVSTDKAELTETEVGHLVDIRQLNGGYWKIITDQGMFIVANPPSGFTGDRVYVRSDGWLFMDKTPYGLACPAFGQSGS